MTTRGTTCEFPSSNSLIVTAESSQDDMKAILIIGFYATACFTLAKPRIATNDFKFWKGSARLTTVNLFLIAGACHFVVLMLSATAYSSHKVVQ